MNVIGYSRVSGKGQVEGDGFDRQEAAIVAFCDTVHADLVTTVREEGISGTVEGMDRPGLCAALDYATANHLDGIVVERLDRLARDLMVQEVLIQEIRKCGLRLFAADQGSLVDLTDDTTDPTRTLIRQIMGALAQWEKSVIVKKLGESRRRARMANGRCEGVKPYGYYPGESETLAVIKHLREEGCDYAEVARFLNESEHKTRKGKPWSADRVYDITGRQPKKGGPPMNRR